MEFISVEELLITLKKKFGKGDNKPTKVTELKQLEQNTHTINEFIQIFRRAARKSKYEGRVLVKELKIGINSTIRHKLIEVK